VKKPKKPESRKAESLGEMSTVIEFICPVRGLVRQEVKGVKYKTLTSTNPRYTAEELLREVDIDDETTDI
jgi:hypothetical protein